MASKHDFSGLSLEELNEVIEEASSLRTSKIEARRKELQAELAKLDSLTVKAPAAKPERSRAAAGYTHVHPKSGHEWLGRGGVPKAWQDIVGKDDPAPIRQEKLKPYRVDRTS